MAIYNKVKNADNLFIKDGTSEIYEAIDGEMKKVTGRIVVYSDGSTDSASRSLILSEYIRPIVVVLLTILFTTLAVRVTSQNSDVMLFTGGITPDFIDLANGSNIRCGDVFLFQDSTGGVYNFNIRNLGCDEFGNTPEDLVDDLYTMYVPDGLRVYGEFGNLITGNVAVPNDGILDITGFTMANGPVEVIGIDTYLPLQPFPPADWFLPIDNPFGTMRTIVPTSGEYNFTIEFTAYPDLFTVFWVYVHCPDQSYTHTTEIIYEELCSNIVDVIEIDTTFIYGQCADTVLIRVPEYIESPISDTTLQICIGDEAFLSPLFDYGLNQTQVEWLDGDGVPFKAFPVYNDTSISFIHYNDDGCVFQNTYYIEGYTDVQLNVDSITVYKGDYVSYNPDQEIYGYDVDFSIESNMQSDDGVVFFLSSVENDTMIYFTYDVNDAGCYENGLLHINVISADVYYPNVFNPSSQNGINTSFRPIFGVDSDAVSYTLDIYTRWGEYVGNFDNGRWNGTFNGQVCNPGTFVYVSTVILVDGTALQFKGDVTLIQ